MLESDLDVPQRRRAVDRRRGLMSARRPCRTPSSQLSPLLIGLDCPEKGGKAVFACTDIARATPLVVWGGSIVDLRGLMARPLRDRRLTIQVDEDAFLVSDVEGPADWVNHSCDPNAGLCGQITLVAMRDIREGEEVCFDYAMCDLSDYDEFDCRCGASCCRGRVTGNDWMRTDLVRRYSGYFAPHVERRIRGAGLLAPVRSGRARRAG